MKIGNTFSAIVVLLALVLAAGGVLIGSPERDNGVAERINLPVANPNAPGRDNPDEIIFEEDWENGADAWETADQVPLAWHKSDFMEREEGDVLWWCGDSITGLQELYVGYDNMWMQYLDTPVLDLSDAGDDVSLTFAAKWLLEDPRRVPPPEGWNGWDGWLVMASTNGGESFSVIEPVSPEYTADHLSAAERFHGVAGDWPGWVFESDPDGIDGWEASDDTVIVPEWVNCEFNLANLRRENVVIRFILFTDRTVAAPYNYYLMNSGVWIDDILIEDGDNVILSNNGDEDPVPSELIPGHDFGFTDTWQVTREDQHSGAFSMWNDDDFFGIINSIDSPAFEVPAEMNTHLEFWVHCDLPDSVHGTSGALSDFYQVFVSNDDGETWTYFIHDYNRDEAGGSGWVHYVPGLHWNVDITDMDLTDYAGSEIRLRWLVRVDNNHINSNNVERNGAGLFIDDIQVIASSQQPRDAGYENLTIPYPTTVRTRTRNVKATMYNYGTRDLTQIWSHWGWFGDENYSRSVRVIPNPSIDSGDSLVINLSDYADRQNPGWTPLYPGEFTVFARTAVGSATPGDDGDDDLYTVNDSIAMNNVRVWPAGIFELGYDNRSVRFRNEFAQGSGAAVRFSPDDVGIQNYSLAFAHFRFNGLEEPASFRLHVRQAGQNDNTPGADIDVIDVEVHPDSSLPGNMTVDLSGREALKDLQGDFWFWAEITRDDFNPQILGDEELRGDGRYFQFNGNQAQAFNSDLSIHAAVVPAANTTPNLAESEQLLDFGEVLVGEMKPRMFGLYSTGLDPVTIRNVSASEESFDVDFPGETTLRTGEAVWFTVSFTAPDDQVHAADLVIESNDESPPNVTIVGSGMVSVEEENAQTPLTFGLSTPYPNPFNSTTRIDYSLDLAGTVKLALFDISGRQIKTLVDGVIPSGRHSATLIANDLPAGLYIVKLEAGFRTSSAKVLLVK